MDIFKRKVNVYKCKFFYVASCESPPFHNERGYGKTEEEALRNIKRILKLDYKEALTNTTETLNPFTTHEIEIKV